VLAFGFWVLVAFALGLAAGWYGVGLLQGQKRT